MAADHLIDLVFGVLRQIKALSKGIIGKLTMVGYSVGSESKYSIDRFRSLYGSDAGLVCTRRYRFMLCGAAFLKDISSHFLFLYLNGSIFSS